MKTHRFNWLVACTLMLGATVQVLAQGTAFTYHGRLAVNGSPTNGSYDLIFSVFDADTNQVGVTITNTDVQVTDGLFIATLDFGADIFTGPDRWLEIGVRTNGVGDFTPLNPRQRLTATPYSIMANTASNLLGTLPAGQLSGTLADGQLPANVSRLDSDGTFTGIQTFNNPTNSFSGSGAGLTGLNASQLASGTLSDARLSSNVARLSAHQTFSGSNVFSGVLQLTNTDNTFVGTFAGNGSGLTALNPANLLAGTAGIDISGNAATATSATAATTASAVPWSGITGIPAGFADGLDQDTLYTAGLGLNLNGTEFSVSFGGSGVAGSAAHSDHNHDTLYAALAHNHDATYSLLGHGHAANDLTSGTLADARLSSNVPLLNAHQTFSGSNLFFGVVQLTNGDNLFNGNFTGTGAGLMGLNPANLSAGTAGINISGNAATATSAAIAAVAATAGSFTGSLAGDVTGAQSATIVASVGGVNAAQVAGGASAANAATDSNTPNTLVKRDSSGSFAAGAMTATSITGGGAGLTALNASALASGTLADDRLSSNVALLNAHQTLSGSNRFSGVVQLTNTDNAFVGTFAGNGSALTGLNPANLSAGMAGIDIGGNAATATTASAVPWSGITGIPAGFADGLDQDTLYSAGIGLNLNGTEFSVSFGGSGVAGSAARSDHDHNSLYAALAHNHDATYSLLGHGHAAADLTSGILADERLSANVALLNAHQTFSGSNTFAGVNTFTNATNTFVGTFAGDGVGLSNLVVMAANVAGPISAEQLSGTLPSRLLAGSYTNAVNFDNPANSYRGNGAWLSNVNAATLEGLGASDFWQLGGNAGTVAGVDFLGTTDDQPLELKVNSTRALRLEPNADGAPNIIGGAPVNLVAESVIGATISGGGTASGMSSNAISSDFATIGGGSGNTIQPLTIAASPFASIGGGQDNAIHGASRSVIAGGANNRIFSSQHSSSRTNINSDSTISGGWSNSVEAPYSTIGGGIHNLIRTNFPSRDVIVPITNGTIAGGISNSIWGNHSTIGGGRHNTIRITGGGPYESNFENGDCTIGGGSFNRLKDSGLEPLTGATIAGGSANVIAEVSDFSFIGGGSSNLIGYGAGPCVISGGRNNRIGHSGGYMAGTIGGGNGNYLWGLHSTISGGKSNSVTASHATIPGGENNTASGDYSFASGRRAKANHTGTFVWADSVDADFASTETNTFSVRSVGGARFVSAIDTDGTPLSGVQLNAGAGSWSSLSDRNAKENFTTVQPREVLDKLSRLPIATWNYRSQDDHIRHIGPMAQDFAAAFQLGENERTISTVDADGVALAAIQGLNEVVKEQQAALKQKDAEIQSLQQRLEALERAILGRETASNGGGQ